MSFDDATAYKLPKNTTMIASQDERIPIPEAFALRLFTTLCLDDRSMTPRIARTTTKSHSPSPCYETQCGYGPRLTSIPDAADMASTVCRTGMGSSTGKDQGSQSTSTAVILAWLEQVEIPGEAASSGS